ncbi:transposase, partial [Nostoc sp. NIES-2111]
MGVLLGLTRGMGRSKKGDRVYDVKPFYRGSRVTVVGAISNKSILSLKTLGPSMNGEDFKKFVEQELLPKLWKGAVVVMDNLKAHKMKGIIEMIESVGARVVYLSPYSPEFNQARTSLVATQSIYPQVFTKKYFGSSTTVVTRSSLMLKSATPKLLFSLLLLYQLVAQSAV